MQPRNKDLRVFITIWSCILMVIGLYPLYKNAAVLDWAVVASLIILSFNLKPALVIPLYNIWVKFGEFIGGYVSKLILLVLYYFVFTLMGIILKILGKDLLNKKIDKKIQSYWIIRETQPNTMKDQF